MRKIKSIFIPFMVAVLCGYGCGKLMYSIYQVDALNGLKSAKLYLLENGEYDSYDEMREDNLGVNYIYYLDGNVYKTVVGITNIEDNVNKIKEIYDEDIEVEEYYIQSDMLSELQSEYDMMIMNTDDTYEVKDIVDDIIELYRSDDNAKLVLTK